MMNQRATLFPLFAALLLPGGASGQTPEAAVQATITQLFDGMRAGDSSMVRAVLHDGVRLRRAMERDGTPTLTDNAVDGWLQAIGTPHDEVWDERIWDLDIQVEGRLATAWMKYAFFRGDTLSHCGVNAMMLFEGANGWKIFALADTGRRSDCWMPPNEQ